MIVANSKSQEIPVHEGNREVREPQNVGNSLSNNMIIHDCDICLSVENLRLKFPGEPNIYFQNLTLHIPQGQKVLILGPSGSGKSTLLQVLCGLIPNSIEVPLKYSHIQLPESWGFVFQDPDTQFCMPCVDEELAFVLENLQVPRQEMESRMREVLAWVGLSLDNLHIPIQKLSQGMKQRLALASVLLLKPMTVFLDEPSALLDPEGTEQIWAAIKHSLNDRTVILVEHKIDAILDWIDRIIMLDEQGRLLADGTPSEVFRSHKSALVRYGIWYPTVWDEYLESSRWKEIKANRQQAGLSLIACSDNSCSVNESILSLAQFDAYRGKQCKLHIDMANIAAQSWIAVTGENGAGKSTLLLALAQLIWTAGKYILHGKEFSEQLKKRHVPEGIALVFQNPEMQFVADSLFDELALPLVKEGKRQEEIAVEVQRLLTYFHMDHLDPQRHPYDLSLGQKRRLSVATAMSRQTSVLLLDEPTFGQDARNTFAILEYLEQLRVNGKTIVMVTHDRRVVEHFATEEWVIEKGRLKEIRKIWRS